MAKARDNSSVLSYLYSHFFETAVRDTLKVSNEKKNNIIRLKNHVGDMILIGDKFKPTKIQ